jgi:hypothetical protein
LHFLFPHLRPLLVQTGFRVLVFDLPKPQELWHGLEKWFLEAILHQFLGQGFIMFHPRRTGRLAENCWEVWIWPKRFTLWTIGRWDLRWSGLRRCGSAFFFRSKLSTWGAKLGWHMLYFSYFQLLSWAEFVALKWCFWESAIPGSRALDWRRPRIEHQKSQGRKHVFFTFFFHVKYFSQDFCRVSEVVKLLEGLKVPSTEKAPLRMKFCAIAASWWMRADESHGFWMILTCLNQDDVNDLHISTWFWII